MSGRWGRKKIAGTLKLLSCLGIRMWFVSFHACGVCRKWEKRVAADDPLDFPWELRVLRVPVM